MLAQQLDAPDFEVKHELRCTVEQRVVLLELILLQKLTLGLGVGGFCSMLGPLVTLIDRVEEGLYAMRNIYFYFCFRPGDPIPDSLRVVRFCLNNTPDVLLEDRPPQCFGKHRPELREVCVVLKAVELGCLQVPELVGDLLETFKRDFFVATSQKRACIQHHLRELLDLLDRFGHTLPCFKFLLSLAGDELLNLIE